MGARLAAMYAAFDADDFLSFTTPRVVRIKDRRLGILSLASQLAIAIYIIVYVIIYQKKYLLYTPVKGLTRLDIWPPTTELLEAPLSDLPYCNTTIPVSQTGRYKTPTMAAPWEQLSCQRYGTTSFGGIIYPADEINAMFVATRVTKSNQLSPGSGCNPEKANACPLGPLAVVSKEYLARPELYTIYIDHTMDVREYKVFRSSNGLKSNGLVDRDGKKVDPCHTYTSRNLACPDTIGSNAKFDHLTIESLLLAAGVPHGSLDSLLDTDLPTSDPMYGETLRAAGMVLIVEIVYNGEVSVKGNAQLVSYTIHASYIPNANYIQYKIDESITSPGTFVETELRGIRIAVRQSGLLGQFNFQVLLLSLVSSIALLTFASVIVKFLAFKVLPNKGIYTQYAKATTFDFSDLSEEQLAVFRANDLVNPVPNPDKFQRKKAAKEAAAAAAAAGAGSGAVATASAPATPKSPAGNRVVPASADPVQSAEEGMLLSSP